MKVKALITALVLGTSSLAMAAPGAQYAKPAYRPIAVGEYHAQKPAVLAGNLTLSKASKRTSVTVDLQRRFSSLQITGLSGQTTIDSVIITFANGERQVVRNLDRRLLANQSVTIDLEGRQRQIKKIAIVGSSANLTNWRRTVMSSIRLTAV